jgi:nucleoside-diphosphate-sugar epimerase
MHILITGAAGFIGQLVAQHLLNDDQHTVLLTDVIDPPIPTGVSYPQNAKTMQADLQSDGADSVVEKHLDAAYLFHGIMSSASESNFPLGISVNLDATRSLLDALRQTCPGIRVIYASSQAVYGRPFPPPSSSSSSSIIDESVRPTPESSYGAAKLMCETLINDYTRRGFIDGLSLRFPSVTVRPGKPTAAASSFLSGVIREPLNGQECTIPLRDRAFTSWVCSPRTLAENLIHALRVPLAGLPAHDRCVNMPGTAVTVQKMLDALEKVGGRERLGLVREVADPAQERILRSWATEFDNSRAYGLGFQRDLGFEQAVMDYKASLG